MFHHAFEQETELYFVSKKNETELTVCIHVLQKMLQLDPSNRISAIAAMEHPYFDSLDKSQF